MVETRGAAKLLYCIRQPHTARTIQSQLLVVLRNLYESDDIQFVDGHTDFNLVQCFLGQNPKWHTQHKFNGS